MAKKKKTDPKLEAWIAARKRHHLSDAHVQMARELGLNPVKLGNIDNHHQESWKAPLPEFIESLYEKRFARLRPEKVLSLEELARERSRKEQARREARAQRRLARTSEQEAGAGDGSGSEETGL
ncbi:MAG TPA: hypothetical protein PKE00_05170 [Planctomycetota bacterium]|nr:hypothetical protein [Planctomycetota bacterium]HMR77876.1 hypothetical protein [Polyangiaceae bacterium]